MLISDVASRHDMPGCSSAYFSPEQNIEGYWNILKKQINGIHHSVSGKHLQRYCDENAFRYNNRDLFKDERFAKSLTNCHGTLKYKVLIGKE